MDPFVVISLGAVFGAVIVLLLLGRFYPGSGADIIDWNPTRSAELEVQNEIDDLEQMLAAANRRRRRRGEVELTEDNVHALLVDKPPDELHEAAEADLAEMLALANARRRRKGQPELTLEQYKAELEGP